MTLLIFLLSSIGSLLDMLLTLFFWLIIGRAILSWFSPDPYNRLVVYLGQVTDPLMQPIQKRLPILGGMLDLSPIVAIFLIIVVQEYLVGSMASTASQLAKPIVGYF